MYAALCCVYDLLAIRALLAERAHAQARDTRRDEHAARVVQRGVLLQQRREDAHRVEDAADVEVHDLGKGLVRVRVKRLAPGGARVGEEDVDAVRVLAHRGQQRVDAVHGGRVGRHGDCLGAGAAAGQGIEHLAGLFAGGGLAG